VRSFKKVVLLLQIFSFGWLTLLIWQFIMGMKISSMQDINYCLILLRSIK
jgi:hypothetical protein